MTSYFYYDIIIMKIRQRRAFNIQSEKEYLSRYNINDYERPSITADIAAFTIRSEESDNYKRNSENKLSVLLIERGEHPYREHWALPGGFLLPNETVEDCALREITEETSVIPASLMPIGVFSEPGRDPRGWIISNVFASVISEESIRQTGGNDASDARWFDVSFEQAADGNYHLDLRSGDIVLNAMLEETETGFGRTLFRIIDSGSLAFDHAGMIATALTVLRESAKNYGRIFDFLPEKFTLTELQKVQETIMNISVLPANFRRKISDYVIETDEYTQGDGHRPARLYRRK